MNITPRSLSLLRTAATLLPALAALPVLAASVQPACPPALVSDLSRLAGEHEEDALTSRCLPWPHGRNTTLAAVAFAAAASDDDDRIIRIVVATRDTRSGRLVLAAPIRIEENAATTFDEDAAASLTIDSGNYELAPGRYAFGIRVRDDDPPECADTTADDNLYLFLPQGGSLPHILDNFPLAFTHVVKGVACGAHRSPLVVDHADFSVTPARDSTHGLRDLTLDARSTVLGLHFRWTLYFDGQAYRSRAGALIDTLYPRWHPAGP